MSDGNLVQVLAGVIRGVIDGDIEPAQANAISATTSQIIKIAKLKLQNQSTVIDSVTVPETNLLTSDVSSEEKLRKAVFDDIASNGESTFRDVSERLGVRWETVENLAKHDWFEINGNKVSIAS